MDEQGLSPQGYSQLGGAPFGISQQQTSQPHLRPERQVLSPDRLTYSEGHVRAQQRAKRVRRPRGGYIYLMFVSLMFICNEIAVDRLFVSDVYDCVRLLVICFYRFFLVI